MVRDKLFIYGELYTSSENSEATEQNRVGYRGKTEQGIEVNRVGYRGKTEQGIEVKQSRVQR